MLKGLFLVDDSRTYPFWTRDGFPVASILREMWAATGDTISIDVQYVQPRSGEAGSLNDYFRDEITKRSEAHDKLCIVTDEDFGSSSGTAGGVVLLNSFAVNRKFVRGCVYSTDPGTRAFVRPLHNLKYEAHAGSVEGRKTEALEIIQYLASGRIPASQDALETNEAVLRLRASIHDLEGVVAPLRSDISRLETNSTLYAELIEDYFGANGYLRRTESCSNSGNLWDGLASTIQDLARAGIMSDTAGTELLEHGCAVMPGGVPADVESALEQMTRVRTHIEGIIKELRRLLESVRTG